MDSPKDQSHPSSGHFSGGRARTQHTQQSQHPGQPTPPPQAGSYSYHQQYQQPAAQSTYRHVAPAGTTTVGGDGRVIRLPQAGDIPSSTRNAPALPGYATNSMSTATRNGLVSPGYPTAPGRGASVPNTSVTHPAGTEQSLRVHFTGKAKGQLEELKADPRYGYNAEQIHEQAVRKYAAEHKRTATRANVRKVSHRGGTNPAEGEHQTVSFKGPGEDGKGVHIPMPPVTVYETQRK